MSRRFAFLTWLAFPVYAWQGLAVRRRTPRMLPAKGPLLHRIDGGEPAVRLLVLGDSSAASVGIDRSDRGLAARLATSVAQATARAVDWRAAGFNSATSGDLRDHVVPHLIGEGWTHVVLSVGTNDTKNFHTIRRFDREFGTLIYAIRARWPQAVLIWSPVVDMTRVPALPPLLGRILEARARAINSMGAQLCRERGAIMAERLPILDPQAGFSSDGFHASEGGYQAWADHLLPIVLSTMDDATPEAVSSPHPRPA